DLTKMCHRKMPRYRAFLLSRPAMVSFVWTEIGFDAGETPEHLVARKEAERSAGSGEFWWGLDASLGITVEVKAEQNGGSLPALFSKSRNFKEQQLREVRI